MSERTAPKGALPSLLTLWPQAGRVLGLSRQATYRAAARGDLPLWSHAGRKKVITAKLAEKIGREITPADIM